MHLAQCLACGKHSVNKTVWCSLNFPRDSEIQLGRKAATEEYYSINTGSLWGGKWVSRGRHGKETLLVHLLYIWISNRVSVLSAQKEIK